MAYSTDADLELRRADILDLLPDGADALRGLAEEQMLKDLERSWFLPTAKNRGVDPRTNPFDPARCVDAELKQLSTLKTLVCVHEHLMRHNSQDPDGFERLRDFYEKAYRTELAELCRSGLDYDWDGSGDLATSEKATQAPRTLMRA